MMWVAAAQPQYVGLSSRMHAIGHAMRYSISRSVHEKNLHLIFVETCFDRLPESIQRQARGSI